MDSSMMSTRSFGDTMGTASTSIEFHKSFQDRALSVQEDHFTTCCGYNWIRDTFKRRDCIRFQFTEEEPGRCQCGRLEEEHNPTKTIGEPEEVWCPETHTKEHPTDAFGELEFQGAWTTTRAKYARVSHNASAEDVLQLFTEGWGLELPKLLIEVTGGAKDFVLQPKLKRIFRQGIVNVAVSTNAWIITGGTNTGVMKHVGKALREHTLRSRNKIFAIGVASWGIIDNKDDLIVEKRHRGQHRKVTHYRMTSSMESKGASLDPNHTHFVLVDDGSVGKYGVEIQLRSKLEKLIAQQRIDPDSDRGIPAVCLALEGGVNTIRTVLENVSKDPPIPAVIAAGSGRGADLIAFAYDCATRQGLLESKQIDQLKSKIAEAFPREVDAHDNIMQYLKKIVARKHLITIFSVDDDDVNQGIDYAILSALLKASNLSISDQLKLALVWNRVDIAQEQIFSKTTHWSEKALEDAMEIALTRNRVDFVKPILEEGLLMTNFVADKLQTLYSYLVEEPFPTLAVLYKVAHLTPPRGGNFTDMKDIGRIIQYLLGKGYVSKYMYTSNGDESKSLCSSPCSLFSCVDRCIERPGEDEIDGLDMFDEEDTSPFDDLFIWAILTKKFQMAYLMWQRGRQSIAKALIGSRLCCKMSEIARAKYNTDAADIIMAESRRYEQVAIGLLDQCYTMAPDYTRCLLCAQMEKWSQQTCLSLAASYNVYKFIAHPAVQDLLQHYWYGKLRKISTIQEFVVWLFGKRKLEEEHTGQVTSRRYTRQCSGGHNLEGDSDGLEMSEGLRSTVEDSNGHVARSMSRSLSLCSGHSMSPSDMRNNTLLHNRQPFNHRTLSFGRRVQAAFQAPIVKFWINTVFYLAFLLLFTYVVLHEFDTSSLRIGEILVAITVFSLGTEEIRQVLMQGERETFTFWQKIKMWANNRWNIWDLFGISLYAIGFILRWPYGPFPSFLVPARVFLVTDIMVWYIRLLDIFSVHKIMGPYVNMIGKMCWDMVYFTVILLVFLTSYGVARKSILYPSPTGTWNWDNLVDIFAIPYWQIYGELFMDDTGMLECRGEGSEGCSLGAAFVPFVMSVYLLIANVLLLNMLIAIFNNTFTSVQENANEIWKFQRYRLIVEFSSRPGVPPPFIMIQHIWMVIQWFLRCCCHKSNLSKEMRIVFDDQSETLLYNFEEECMGNYLRQLTLQEQASMPGLIQRINERVEAMALYMEELKRREEKDRRLRRKETMERTVATWNTNGKSSGQAGSRGSQGSKSKEYSRGLSC
ncbi:transient receptor potential cation channel subfamily M member 3-like [Amphiura filiformis]|uniref:transient receptor potential cation channel subfamily M member 3-like n=1 Tax=Amphiura filiformis TaxID=82378 RepID=UPI003B22183E